MPRVLKVGDYVETCHLMPAILEKIRMYSYANGIDKEIDKLHISEYSLHNGNIQYDVEVFYPHYKEQYPEYNGGSNCSVKHCGVHRISKARFDLLMKIGNDNLSILWQTNLSIDWELLTELYSQDDLYVRKHIPIKKVLGKGVVEYKDGQIWQCKKHRICSNWKQEWRRIRNSSGKHKYFYMPIKRIR